MFQNISQPASSTASAEISCQQNVQDRSEGDNTETISEPKRPSLLRVPSVSTGDVSSCDVSITKSLRHKLSHIKSRGDKSN